MPAVIERTCRRIVESSWFDPLMLGDHPRQRDHARRGDLRRGRRRHRRPARRRQRRDPRHLRRGAADPLRGHRLQAARLLRQRLERLRLHRHRRELRARHPRERDAAAARPAAAHRPRRAAAARPARAHHRGRPVGPGRREPGGAHAAARLHLRHGRLGHLQRPRPGELREHRAVDGHDVHPADAREPAHLHRHGGRSCRTGRSSSTSPTCSSRRSSSSTCSSGS